MKLWENSNSFIVSLMSQTSAALKKSQFPKFQPNKEVLWKNESFRTTANQRWEFPHLSCQCCTCSFIWTAIIISINLLTVLFAECWFDIRHSHQEHRSENDMKLLLLAFLAQFVIFRLTSSSTDWIFQGTSLETSVSLQPEVFRL